MRIYERYSKYRRKLDGLTGTSELTTPLQDSGYNGTAIGNYTPTTTGAYDQYSAMYNTTPTESSNTGSNSSFWNYANIASSTLSPMIEDATTATPTTDKQKYVNSYVSQKGPDSTMEELSYGITDMNPIASVAHDVGAAAGDIIAPTNEYGYSDSSNFAVGMSGLIDPGQTTDYAMQQFEEGDTGAGILSLISPYYAADAQNREAKANADKASRKYNQEQLYNKLHSSNDTYRVNQSRYGNTYTMRNGGNLSQGGDITKHITPSVNAVQYYGPKHEQGGIPIGKSTEVESGETKYKSYVFSDTLEFN